MQPRFPISVPIPMPWSSFKPLLEQIREKVPLPAPLSIRDAQPVFFFFFLVEYIQWFQIIVDRSCLHAGRVQDLLDRATGQVLREGLREKIHSGKPTADIPTFNIRCNKLIHCNFYSFSRKQTKKNQQNQNPNNFIFPPACKRGRILLLLKQSKKPRERS